MDLGWGQVFHVPKFTIPDVLSPSTTLTVHGEIITENSNISVSKIEVETPDYDATDPAYHELRRGRGSLGGARPAAQPRYGIQMHNRPWVPGQTIIGLGQGEAPTVSRARPHSALDHGKHPILTKQSAELSPAKMVSLDQLD